MKEPMPVDGYRFGPFELELQSERLLKHGRPVRLPGRAYRALEILLENAGEVVSREELRARVWPEDVHVEFEHGLNNTIHDLREALGEARSAIVTLPRQGYRFLGDVERVRGNDARGNAYPLALVSGVIFAALALSLWTQGGVDPRAQEALLRGDFFLARKTPDAVEKSLEAFEEASRLEPELASAHAGRARAYHFLGALGRIEKDEARRQTVLAASRALELDPTCGAALAILAESRFRFAGSSEGVEELFERALALEPDSAEMHQWYGNFLALEGRIEEGIRRMERARRLEPLSLHINSDLGALLYESGRRDEAMAQFDRTLELDPRYAKTHFLLGYVHLAEGDVAEALASFERSVSFSPDTPKYQNAYAAALARLP